MTENEGLWPLCETCGAVPTSHRDYNDCEKHMQVVARAYEAGRAKEREDVVVWLHAKAEAWSEDILGSVATDIDCGEHRSVGGA